VSEGVSAHRTAIDPASLDAVPHEPGAYLFRDQDGVVIYVGKAKDLRRRLASYLRPGAGLTAKTKLMLSRAASYEFVGTNSEKEAYILEATLIKRHRPRYNVVLRDDKAYPFLCIDPREPFPAVRVTRRRDRDGCLYFGPYPSGLAVRETLRIIQSLFALRTCTNAGMKGRTRPCLKGQIGRCSAPCIGAVSQDEYGRRIYQVRLFLEGRTTHLVTALTTEMEAASQALEFERAALLRDRIQALEAVAERQSVACDTHADLDVIGYEKRLNRAAVSLLRVRNGILQGQEIHRLEQISDETDPEVLSIFLRQYYRDAPAPREIILPFEADGPEIISEWLSERTGRRVLFKSSVRDVRRKFLELAQKNASMAADGIEHGERSWERVSARLKEVLGLSRPPDTIEAVDISTTGGELPVGSLVRFRKGRPEKAGYRHFSLTGFAGMDDFAMIRTVMERRLARGLETDDLPDLFLIDGGRGQLHQATEALEDCGLPVPPALASLAKEHLEEGEKIFLPKRDAPIFLEPHDPALLCLQRIRDEAHRFGIGFHRKKRDATRMRSVLLDIPGIGPRKRLALLRRFGSVKQIQDATVEDIAAVPGITRELAMRIKQGLS